MSRVDINQLIKELRQLERHQVLYRVLKKELSALGYWRNKPRGNPAKGYKERGKNAGDWGDKKGKGNREKRNL